MKYRLTKVRAVFTRCGYAVQLLNDDGTPHSRMLTVVDVNGRSLGRAMSDSTSLHFYGNDGRKVRAEAVAFARRSHGATQA